MIGTIARFISTILRWGIFLFICFLFWFILTIINPDMRFIVIIFAVIFTIFNFPKSLLFLIIAWLTSLKQRFISFEDEETSEDIELEEDDSQELSTFEELIYKGSIVLSMVFICLIAYFYMHNRDIEHQIALVQAETAGFDITSDPIQINNASFSFSKITGKNKYNIKPLARYKIAGIVVVKNTFMLLDPVGDLSPVDIGLVWGDLAKPENYKRMTFYSNFRLMSYTRPGDLTIDNDYITRHSSHNHIIPANDSVKSSIMNLNKDDKVLFDGYLVEVTGNNGLRPWRSSLKRDDHLFNSGAGCEILYVEKVIKL